MLVAIAGLPGSGKSTAARLVAKELGVPAVTAGEIFRGEANRRGMTLLEFSILAEGDFEVDKALDKEMEKVMRAGDAVVEGRLVAYVAQWARLDCLKIWLEAPPEVRAQRVGGRDDLEKAAAAKANRAREESEAKRYREIYGIDILDTSVYDMKIDSSKHGPDAIAELIVKEARARFA
jgi:cytidylate kinase